jgi:hypothetical protein
MITIDEAMGMGLAHSGDQDRVQDKPLYITLDIDSIVRHLRRERAHRVGGFRLPDTAAAGPAGTEHRRLRSVDLALRSQQYHLNSRSKFGI